MLKSLDYLPKKDLVRVSKLGEFLDNYNGRYLIIYVDIYFEYRITPRRLNSSNQEEFPTNETELDVYLDLNLRQNVDSNDTTYNDSDNLNCYNDKQSLINKLNQKYFY